MSRFLRGIRLLPVVLFAAGSLLALKMAGIVAGGGYRVVGPPVAIAQPLTVRPTDAAAGERGTEATRVSDVRRDTDVKRESEVKRSWAQDMFNYPEVTGSVAAKTTPGPDAAKPAVATKPSFDQADKGQPGKPKEPNAFTSDSDRPLPSAGERAVLERLQERRQELDARARELEIREGLLKAAEKRIEARIGELKELEGQITAATQKKDEAEVARFKALVSMYENMKAKEAARVFDRLEMRILLDVATQINPRRMSDILAQMTPEAAERLTVELASRSPAGGKPTSAADLPKIEGRPRT